MPAKLILALAFTLNLQQPLLLMRTVAAFACFCALSSAGYLLNDVVDVEADRAVMAAQALQNQRREEQQVKVTYDDRPAGTDRSAATPRTPEEIVPPAEPAPRGTDVDGPGRADASGPGED